MLLTHLHGSGGKGKILVGPRKQTQRLTVPQPLIMKLTEHGIGTLDIATACQRKTLELVQSHVVGPGLQAGLDGVIAQQRLPRPQQPLCLRDTGPQVLVGMCVRLEFRPRLGLVRGHDLITGFGDGEDRLPRLCSKCSLGSVCHALPGHVAARRCVMVTPSQAFEQPLKLCCSADRGMRFAITHSYATATAPPARPVVCGRLRFRRL